MNKSKLNNWFITFISRKKKMIYYDEYNRDIDNIQLCGEGNGCGCGDGYGKVSGEVFSYEPDQYVDNHWVHCANGNGALNGDGFGDGRGDGRGDENGNIRE